MMRYMIVLRVKDIDEMRRIIELVYEEEGIELDEVRELK